LLSPPLSCVISPAVDKREFQKSGEEAGAAAGQGAGKTFGDGFKRGSDGKLRDSHGKFVKDSEAAASDAGGKAGAGFGNSVRQGLEEGVDSLKEQPQARGGRVRPARARRVRWPRSGRSASRTRTTSTSSRRSRRPPASRWPRVAEGAQARRRRQPARRVRRRRRRGDDRTGQGRVHRAAVDGRCPGTLQLARVANISEADAAEIAANAVNAFGIEAKDTTFVVDELAAAANSSSIEITDASDAFKQAAAVFSGTAGPGGRRQGSDHRAQHRDRDPRQQRHQGPTRAPR
jgi:hypothetical protein